MPVKSINSSVSNARQNNRNNKNVKHQSFTGSFNPVVMVMDGIEKGGFAASFIVKDGLGMVAPRIYEGLNRNRKTDENGKKTGPLNWEFARREGIREILSGPSAFLIPLGIMGVIKNVSGKANNVHVSHIEALGEYFTDYASKENLKDFQTFKQGFYTKVFEKAFEASTDNEFKNKVQNTAKEFSDNLLQVEKLRDGKNKKQANNLKGTIVNNYMKIRKAHSAPSDNDMVVRLNLKDKSINTNIETLIQSMQDYADDAFKKANKYLEHNSESGLKEYIKNFNHHRAGTRVLSNLGMWSAVVGFYTLIPKLYNLGLKHDPGLKGLVDEESIETKENTKNKDVAFTGAGSFFANTGKNAMKDNKFSKLLSKFEFNGASMSVPAMLTLLFGFCLPPRYVNAKSDKERKEILVRDISSFTAILFGAEALSRGFSDIFAKVSGLALNTKPENHNKNIWNKLKNYFSPGNGVNVLSSRQIVSKYSNIDGYKDGINGFFKFLEQNGGDVKKVLNIDETVKQHSEQILKEFANKSLKNATLEDIHNAFRQARIKKSDALEKIYSVFSNTDNKFINRAKTLNSAFGFLSTIVLVPTFMMWIARYCENMTKKAIAREKEEKAALNSTPIQQTTQTITPTNKPTMAGFLNK